MSNIRISQLSTVVALTDNDLMVVSSADTSTTPTTYSSVKSPVSQVAAKIVEDTTFTTSLKTTNKTVSGAINETLSNFANEYSTSSAYAVGDCVLYAGSIYQCTTAIPSGEAWDSTHWTQIKAVDVGSGGGGGSSTLAGLSDVTLSSPSDGQVLKYDSTSQKWINGTGGGSSGDHVTLTQAEYDALVQAGTVDPNAFYFITDTNGDGQDFQPIIRSLEEREIGVWTDGKPLYEKTIYNAGGTYGTISIAHNITNLGHCVNAFGTSYDIGYQEGSQRIGAGDLPLPRVAPDGNNVGIIGVNSTEINLMIPNAFNDRITDIYITLQYTKSTDQAGSGTWTPQGVPAVHYSTDEQVVGTWIDGNTLYEKTIARTFTADEVYTVFASGIDIAFITSCYFEYTSGSNRYMSPYYISSTSASNNISINSDILSGALRIVNQTQSSKYFVVTVRYTKTST